ncbi:hypothetical protein DL93DRAFT_262591 [Clavulina sp. PMI_390]|nr:hypothetical protein DL93DRAFT_262591 [Clavulina sp. PMI_390]
MGTQRLELELSERKEKEKRLSGLTGPRPPSPSPSNALKPVANGPPTPAPSQSTRISSSGIFSAMRFTMSRVCKPFTPASKSCFKGGRGFGLDFGFVTGPTSGVEEGIARASP